MDKIKYGQEKRFNGYGGIENHPEQCPDCAVNKGQEHLQGCDIEECPNCGCQLIGCDCNSEFTEEDSTFSIDELNLISECIGVTINEYEGCHDLTDEYNLLDKIDKIIEKLTDI